MKPEVEKLINLVRDHCRQNDLSFILAIADMDEDHGNAQVPTIVRSCCAQTTLGMLASITSAIGQHLGVSHESMAESSAAASRH